MTFELRPYQQAAVDAGVRYLTDPGLAGRNGLIVAPTGSGKSLLIANLCLALSRPTIVFQPSKEILQQNARKLAAYGYPPALFSASVGRRDIGRITLATIGSVAGHEEAFRDVEYVLVDEAHCLNPKGGQYAAFLRACAHARVMGATATPFRLHSNSLGSSLRFLNRTRPKLLDDVVHVTQVQELLDAGYLAPLEYRVRPLIDLDRLRWNTQGSDFADHSVQLAFEGVGFEDRLVDEVRALLDEGRRHVLIFTRFVDEATRVARALPDRVAVVTGETPAREREQLLEAFQAGRIRAVANVGVLTTGYDFPALDTVVLARPTASLGLYYQMVGRGVRTAPGKDRAVVVDLVGLVKRFGRFEDLRLERAGKRGDLWVMRSHGRDLTNVVFGQPDEKTQKRADYWKRRKGHGRPGQGQGGTRVAGHGLF